MHPLLQRSAEFDVQKVKTFGLHFLANPVIKTKIGQEE